MTNDSKQAGLVRKYDVRRLRDVDGRHEDCEFFILDLSHDQWAVVAAKEYAQLTGNAALLNDLNDRFPS
jgi:hypothetical protein